MECQSHLIDVKPIIFFTVSLRKKLIVNTELKINKYQLKLALTK